MVAYSGFQYKFDSQITKLPYLFALVVSRTQKLGCVACSTEKSELSTSAPRLKTNLTKIFFVFLTFTLFTKVFNAYDKVHSDYWWAQRYHGKPERLSSAPFFDVQALYHNLFPKGIQHAR